MSLVKKINRKRRSWIMSQIAVEPSLLLPPKLQKLLIVVATDMKKLVDVTFYDPCSIILSPLHHCPTLVKIIIDGRSNYNGDRSLDSTATKVWVWRRRRMKLKLDSNDVRRSGLTTIKAKQTKTTLMLKKNIKHY